MSYYKHYTLLNNEKTLTNTGLGVVSRRDISVEEKYEVLSIVGDFCPGGDTLILQSLKSLSLGRRRTDALVFMLGTCWET